MFWKRDWELIDKEVLPSGFEQAVASGHVLKKATGGEVFRKAVVLTFKCKLTGKIKIEQRSNP